MTKKYSLSVISPISGYCRTGSKWPIRAIKVGCVLGISVNAYLAHNHIQDIARFNRAQRLCNEVTITVKKSNLRTHKTFANCSETYLKKMASGKAEAWFGLRLLGFTSLLSFLGLITKIQPKRHIVTPKPWSKANLR